MLKVPTKVADASFVRNLVFDWKKQFDNNFENPRVELPPRCGGLEVFDGVMKVVDSKVQKVIKKREKLLWTNFQETLAKGVRIRIAFDGNTAILPIEGANIDRSIASRILFQYYDVKGGFSKFLSTFPKSPGLGLGLTFAALKRVANHAGAKCIVLAVDRLPLAFEQLSLKEDEASIYWDKIVYLLSLLKTEGINISAEHGTKKRAQVFVVLTTIDEEFVIKHDGFVRKRLYDRIFRSEKKSNTTETAETAVTAVTTVTTVTTANEPKSVLSENSSNLEPLKRTKRKMSATNTLSDLNDDTAPPTKRSK